jgi:sugar lactone lactonase YvrE
MQHIHNAVDMAADPSEVRAVTEPCLLGESPFWHPQEECLYWCDIPGRRLHRLHPASGNARHWSFDCEPSACAPCQVTGQLILAMRDGLWRFNTATGQRERLAAPPYNPARERFNDGKCDPRGRFWVGTIYEPRDTPSAALYCYDRHTLEREADSVTVSNGLAWSPDGRTQYWSDTKAHTIYRLPVDAQDGSIGSRAVFAHFPLKQAGQDLSLYAGRPDGAAVDQEGCYWVAMFEGQQILRLDPRGQVIARVMLPVRCPTMPCFGGADLKTLYITTGRENRPPEELATQPLCAGCPCDGSWPACQLLCCLGSTLVRVCPGVACQGFSSYNLVVCRDSSNP